MRHLIIGLVILTMVATCSSTLVTFFVPPNFHPDSVRMPITEYHFMSLVTQDETYQILNKMDCTYGGELNVNLRKYLTEECNQNIFKSELNQRLIYFVKIGVFTNISVANLTDGSGVYIHTSQSGSFQEQEYAQCMATNAPQCLTLDEKEAITCINRTLLSYMNSPTESCISLVVLKHQLSSVINILYINSTIVIILGIGIFCAISYVAWCIYQKRRNRYAIIDNDSLSVTDNRLASTIDSDPKRSHMADRDELY